MLETVTQEIRKLVPGIVLKTVVADTEPTYTGATN